MEYVVMPQWLTELFGLLALLGFGIIFAGIGYYLIKQSKIDEERKLKFIKALDLFIEKSELENLYLENELGHIKKEEKEE